MTMPLSAEIETLARKKLAAITAQRRESFDSDTLLWLALVPEWTIGLATACHLPTGHDDLGEVIQRLEAARYCVTASSAPDKRHRRFWMPASRRDKFLREWSDNEPRRVRMVGVEIARRALEAAEQGVTVAPGILCWAILTIEEVKQDVAVADVGDALLHRVGRCIQQQRPGDATGWIYAAEALEPVLQAPMESAIVRAKRRLNLHFRAVRDERYLRHFLRRGEQIEALDRLLDGTSGNWALHFVGRGGAGKTMLLRHLTGPYARQHDLVTARVDFDHLDPRYPTDRPGRLLHELAEGLAIYADQRRQEFFLRGLWLASERAEVVAKDQALDGYHRLRRDSPELDDVIGAFAAFARSFDRKVVLVLDTCEELAKLHPVGVGVPSIDVTFEILRRVRAQVPGLFVVLAGRRRLAPRAVRVPAWTQPWRPASTTSVMPPEYLRVHEIRGFDRDEALSYLRETRELDVPDRILETVLKRSTSTEQIQSRDARAADGQPEFNPYDIAMFADWLADNDAPGLMDFALGETDPYVAARIIEPLAHEPEVLAALPTAAILGRFDASTLQAAIKVEHSVKPEVIRKLADQEWITLSQASESDAMILEIERPLLRRLRDYYAHPDRSGLQEVAINVLQPVLLDVLNNGIPGSTTPEEVIAAIHVLRVDLAAAGWELLTARIADAEAWAWAENICARLLAVDEGDVLRPQLRAAVRAVYAAALLHRDAKFDARSLWLAIAEEADEHPDQSLAAALKARAGLYRLTWAVKAGEHVKNKQFRAIIDAYHQAPPGSARPALVGLLEAQVDRPPPGSIYPYRADRVLKVLQQSVPQKPDAVLEPFVWLLEARLAFFKRNRPNIVGFPEALHLAPRGVTRQQWQDWVAPASLRHRILLEQLRHALADATLPVELFAKCERAAFNGPPSVDADRLLSLATRARLASAPLEPRRLKRLIAHARSGLYPGTAPAHHSVPPLFCTVGEALLAAGRAQDALNWLVEHELGATRAGEEELAREASKAIVVTLRRLRLDERLGQVLALCGTDQRRDVRREALATAALVTGVLTDLRGGVMRHDDHERWRVTDYLNPREVPEPSKALKQETQFARPDSALDLLEEVGVLTRLRGRHAVSGARRKRLQHHAEVAMPTARQFEPDRPLAWAEQTTELRAEALGIVKARKLIEQPHRAAGIAALEEGALLGLRLPKQAVTILSRAVDHLGDGNDPIARFQALLCLAIARIHAGERRSAKAMRSEIGHAFELATQASSEMAGEVSGVAADNPWRGWLARYAAYGEWCTTVRAPIIRSGGHEDRGSAELRLAPAEGSPGPILGLTSTRLSPVLATLVMAAGLSVGLGVTALVARGLDLAPQLVLPAVIALIAAIMAALWRQLVPQIWRFAIRLFALDLTIFEASRSPAVRVQLGGRTRMASMYARFSMALTRRLKVNRDFHTPPFTFRWASNDEGRAEREHGMSGLGPRRGRRAAALRMLVAPELAADPWEARLFQDAPSSRGTWDPAQASATWRRSIRRRRAVGWGSDLISTIAPDQWSQLAALWELESELQVRPLADADVSEASDNRGLLIVGSPVVTSAGWRMRTGDPLIGLATRGVALRRERLIAPNLTDSNTALIAIVVGIPGGDQPLSDPQVAGGLRGFAGELFSSGAGAVITIPPLPLLLTAQLLTDIGAAFRGWKDPPSTDEIVRLITALRQRVYERESQPTTRDEHLERMRVAYDLCLYAGSDID